ncbi:MAG: recombinase RecX [Gammaproteobacteria bacterium]|nr:MAG: recombinase RecX [Gammaproteobacteria bacterium]PIE37171.1 MAG: recombinase RecX [Gammaproteobacteria bacterium]
MPRLRSLKTPDSSLYRSLHDRAVRLLARRDHSRAELTRKLSRPQASGRKRRNRRASELESGAGVAEIDAETLAEVIEAVLDALVEAGYLNDARYAASLAEQRRDKGYGPLAIRAKLGERGIDSELQRDALDELGQEDWVGNATEALQRRFSDAELASGEQRERARQARFLRARGFDSATARRAADVAQRTARAAIEDAP